MPLSTTARISTIVLFLLSASSAAQDFTVTTYAGRTHTAGIADGPLRTATFGRDLSGIAADSDGGIYVADIVSAVIRKISTQGQVTTLAGAAGMRGTTDGRGFDARFESPQSIATDLRNGYIYVADQLVIRRITPAGLVTTLAGTYGQYGSADGIGSAARFNCSTCGIATDSSGNVYVADSGNVAIRKITPTGVVTTWAGSPSDRGSTDGIGTEASFSNPTGVAIDANDNVYVADVTTQTIRKITPAAVVTTLSTSAPLGALRGSIAVDRSGTVYVVADLTVKAISADGTVRTLVDRTTYNPTHLSVGVDASDNVIVTSDGTILRVSGTGMVSTIFPVGTVRDGDARDVSFNTATGVAADADGNLYVADWLPAVIYKVSSDGVVSVFAGSVDSTGTADGTRGEARFERPIAMVSDSAGNLFVLDMNAIRKITPAGVVTTFAGDIASSGNRDDVGIAARFNDPEGIAIDAAGNLYVADLRNDAVRKVTPDAVVTTVGSIQQPFSIAVHRDGSIYIGKLGGIWKLGSGVVAGGQTGTRDGAAVEAQFCMPTAMAFAANDDLFIADASVGCQLDGGTIRKMTPSGAVSTVAGTPRPRGNYGLSVDGEGSSAVFTQPMGLTTQGGRIYVADSQSIRLARRTNEDVAIVDSSSITIGGTFHFDTAAQTATAWRWSLTRCPADATADLSSYTQRNPTFSPDVAGVYTFQLLAEADAAARLSTLDVAVVALQSQTQLSQMRGPSASSPAHKTIGAQTASFVARVTGGARGNVWFADNGVPHGSVPVRSGEASLSMILLPGTHSVTAIYEGDERLTPSVSNAVMITVGLAASSTIVVSSLNPSGADSSVTFTATVAGSNPTGTVQFFDGATALGPPVTLAGGVAMMTTSALLTGTHTVTAVYSGDANNATSVSPPLTQTVVDSVPAFSGAILLLLAAGIAAAGMLQVRSLG